MKNYSDEKGKFFTNVVSKQAVPVVIQAVGQTIAGEIYIRPDDRLIDDLNHAERFLAVTNAVVFSPAGEELYRAGFFSLNKDHVVWVMPGGEITRSPDGRKGQ